MSLDKRSFSKIVVNDDEDFIIQAGALSNATFDKQDKPRVNGVPSEETVSLDEPQGARQSTSSSSEVSQEREGVRAASTSVEEVFSEALSSSEGGEFSASDLEAEPMSLMQKVIIALALVLIVAALVYYFVFMR